MPRSWASSVGARRSLQSNKGRDTKPELRVRRLVHGAGLRYRVNARPEADLRRTADSLFRPAGVAVFIDGCFWHGCADHYRASHMNAQFWLHKVARNQERDAETTAVLTERGWAVPRFWEHEDSADVADRIIAVVKSRRAGTPGTHPTP